MKKWNRSTQTERNIFFVNTLNTNYQKRARSTFDDDHFLYIINYNKNFFFLNDCPRVIQLFYLHAVVFVEYNKDIKRAYWITGEGGGRCSVLDLLFRERGWLYLSRHKTV